MKQMPVSGKENEGVSSSAPRDTRTGRAIYISYTYSIAVSPLMDSAVRAQTRGSRSRSAVCRRQGFSFSRPKERARGKIYGLYMYIWKSL